MRVEPYNESRKAIWDAFVQQSKNGSFLFQRDYMEYHGDRFLDNSLLLYDDSDSLTALLPATRSDRSVSSHGGLTHGGFVTGTEMKLPKMLQVFEAAIEHLQQQGICELSYKTVPYIYHRIPAEEDRYALFLCNSRLLRCGALAVITDAERPAMQERRKRGAKKAEKRGLRVAQSQDWHSYWTLLSERLRETYQAAPVHTLSEILLLQARFPTCIKLFAVFQDDLMVAGVVIYESDLVARSQYIAANALGRELGALDFLFTELLMEYYRSKPYFDFGTSDEDNGRQLNAGLIDQKEGYGARTVAHDHYLISIADCKPGQLVGALR